MRSIQPLGLSMRMSGHRGRWQLEGDEKLRGLDVGLNVGLNVDLWQC